MLDVKLKLREGHTSEREWMSLDTLTKLFWNMTYACNFHCGICFSAAGRPSPEELTAAEARELLIQAQHAGVQELIISGGEPFMYPPLFGLLTEMARMGMSARIATNGSLINGELIRRLRGETLVHSFQVSLDTLEPQRYGRLHGCSPAVLDSVLHTLGQLQQAGFHTTVSLRLTPETAPEVTMMLDRAVLEGWATVTIHLPVPVHRLTGGWGIGVDVLSHLEPIFAHFCALPQRWLVETYIPWAPYHETIQRFASRIRFVHRGCSAGRDRLTVTPTGHLVPCVCMNQPTAHLGNIRHDNLERVFRQAPLCELLRHPEQGGVCSECSHLAQCGGGCRTVALARTGRFDGQDEMCPIWLTRAGSSPHKP